MDICQKCTIFFGEDPSGAINNNTNSHLYIETAPLTRFKAVKIVYIDLVVSNKLLLPISPFSVTCSALTLGSINHLIMLHNAILSASTQMCDCGFVRAFCACLLFVLLLEH